MSEQKKMDPRIKAATDFGPLLIFFVTFYTKGIIWATGAIVLTTLIALAVTYALERRIAPMPLASGILITVFGGATLILNDPFYVMLKTTVFFTLVASVLGVGLLADRPLIKYVFNEAFDLPHAAWRILTWRWIAFAVCVAVLNMAVYFTFGLEFWVNFKVWALLIGTFLFVMSQMPFIAKNQIASETSE